MKTNASKCDKCGKVVRDIDAGFSPSLQEMAHDCGGTWQPIVARSAALERHAERIAARLPHVRERLDNAHISTTIVWEVDLNSPDADLIRADAKAYGLACSAHWRELRELIVEE